MRIAVINATKVSIDPVEQAAREYPELEVFHFMDEGMSWLGKKEGRISGKHLAAGSGFGELTMIYIIRHGKTEMNQANVLQGRSDHPLNDDGILQAKMAADKLKEIHFDYVFSSPLTRAVQTAEIIAPHMTPVIDERLIEMDYGPYEGTDLNNLPQEIITFFSDFVHNPAPEGMEQLSSVTARAGSFLEEIRSLSGNILISTHAIAMKGLLEYLTPESNGSYWSKYIGNCAVYMAENDNGQIGKPKELKDWSSLTHEEKNHQLFLKQKALLDQFMEKGAISQEQHDKSLHDLTEKMGETKRL